MFYGDGYIMVKRKRICGKDGCDGVMIITYIKRRDGGDVLRTRKCSKCKRYIRTVEVEQGKYEKMRKLVKDLQVSYSEFVE